MKLAFVMAWQLTENGVISDTMSFGLVEPSHQDIARAVNQLLLERIGGRALLFFVFIQRFFHLVQLLVVHFFLIFVLLVVGFALRYLSRLSDILDKLVDAARLLLVFVEQIALSGAHDYL